jgi:hypothetical protein
MSATSKLFATYSTYPVVCRGSCAIRLLNSFNQPFACFVFVCTPMASIIWARRRWAPRHTSKEAAPRSGVGSSWAWAGRMAARSRVVGRCACQVRTCQVLGPCHLAGLCCSGARGREPTRAGAMEPCVTKDIDSTFDCYPS